MKVTFFVCSDDFMVGSIKSRVLLLQKYLNQNNIETEVYSPNNITDYSTPTDIMIFLKTFTEPWLTIAKEGKKSGSKIILELEYCTDVGEMFHLADIIVVGGMGLYNFYKKKNPDKIISIPDSVRYLEKPLPLRCHTKEDNLNIAYFVAPCNIKNILICYDALKLLKKKFKLHVITGRLSYCEDCFKGLNWKWITWKENTFIQELQKCDFAILPQRQKWKCNPKLIDAITANIPAICSNIPDYEWLAIELGIEEFLCKSTNDWIIAMEKMFNPVVRNEFLQKGLNRVWTNYNITSIGERWLKLFQELRKK